MTEQRRMELEIIESEARYKDLFENADEPMYTIDTSGCFQAINKAGLRILGAEKEEVTGSHISRWLTPESFKLSQEVLEKQISGEHCEQPIVIEVINKNGEHILGEIATRVIREGDRIIGIHGIARDITENLRLEQELLESEAKYRDLFENADDPMFTLDTEGNFLELNNAGLKLLGCTRNELIGSHFSKWTTPESNVNALDAIKKRLMGETIEPPTILEMVSSNGEHRWIEVRSSILKEGNAIKGLHGIARDITEKMRLENKLKEYNEMLLESEARYKDLFDNAADPMYTLDEAWYFREINNAGIKVLGATREEIIGSHISRWLTPESLNKANERLNRIARGLPVPETIVYELICKNDERRWAEIRNRPIKEGNRITGFQGNARDVTEKRKLELQLKEYHEKLQRSCEELIEADRLKTEFVSNITHELLTPMTSIKGFTELLYDETTGKINKEQKNGLGIILRNSDRLIRLIKDLLDVASLEKNKFSMKFECVQMSEIISKTIQDMQPHAMCKEIRIINKVAPLPAILGDDGRLTQVITNLLFNAIKFTPEKGTITVIASENTNNINISVIDTGIGIPADELPRIFDRFYQIDGSNSRKYGGTGLGLSICKSIIEQHYGSIKAQSDCNGSTFHIMLPKPANNTKRS
ncbi:MAG TPA: PAS domain S-box protein [candidate division Zixibacteria bacterium]|nr:PAS domain S-box protein [candidate division Zixibacteria bacterium]